MNINDYKYVRILKWVLFYTLCPFIKIEYRIWHLFNKVFNKNNKIKRFFSSSGNISLINILAIINETGNFEKYEDYLFIDTGKGRKEFVEKQMEIANLHKFKKIFIGYQIPPGITAVLNNFYKADEVYLLNHPAHIKTVAKLYPKVKIILIDEGPASLINYDIENINNLEKIKTHKYINKLDFFGLNKPKNYKFETIDISEFNKICDILSNKYPIQISCNKEDKYILYCGIYWEVSGLCQNEFSCVQKEVIQNLLDKGYKILYKPHPRDNEFYGFDKNPNVQFITSRFPIELYNFDVVAIVSVSSTASITPAHYRAIPSFSHVTDKAINHTDKKGGKLDLVKRIVKEYSPDYQELLKFDVQNTTKQELKQKLDQLYTSFVRSKPLLSENKNLAEAI